MWKCLHSIEVEFHQNSPSFIASLVICYDNLILISFKSDIILLLQSYESSQWEAYAKYMFSQYFAPGEE